MAEQATRRLMRASMQTTLQKHALYGNSRARVRLVETTTIGVLVMLRGTANCVVRRFPPGTAVSGSLRITVKKYKHQFTNVLDCLPHAGPCEQKLTSSLSLRRPFMWPRRARGAWEPFHSEYASRVLACRSAREIL
jgi:hypothetical protein